MVDNKEIKEYLISKIHNQAHLLGIETVKVKEDTDLIKEGYFDSLSFVDLIVDCEEKFNVTIELDSFEPAYFSKFGNLVSILDKALNK